MGTVVELMGKVVESCRRRSSLILCRLWKRERPSNIIPSQRTNTLGKKVIILAHRKCQVHQVQPGGFGYWICLKELKDVGVAPAVASFSFFFPLGWPGWFRPGPARGPLTISMELVELMVDGKTTQQQQHDGQP
jgi:hypothetical protein